MITEIQNTGKIIICGDGRHDSMGHSAKYGAYTIMCSKKSKIIHFELVQGRTLFGAAVFRVDWIYHLYIYL